MRRAVFLDRDGVINRAVLTDGKAYPPQSIEDFEILPRVPEAVQRLKEHGYLVIVATNQPDVATGRQSRARVEAMNERVREVLAVDDIKVCYHVDRDGCSCRKPKPGMLTEAAAQHDLDLGRSFMVGDRWRDVDAGRAAGCITILVGSGYAERPSIAAHYVCDSLWEAVGIVLTHNRD